jgi:hypothetical protein
MSAKEDLEILDVKVSRLKVEYEQYFMRILKREPLLLRGEVERIIRRYTNQIITNTAIKFKFNSIVSKYNAYKQYWTRTLRAIEEGTYERRAEGGGTPWAVRVSNEPLRANPSSRAAGPSEDGFVEGVYQKYLEARKKCNQPTDGLTFERLKEGIEQEKKKIESKYGTKDVDLQVFIKDGTAKISIVPKKT